MLILFYKFPCLFVNFFMIFLTIWCSLSQVKCYGLFLHFSFRCPSSSSLIKTRLGFGGGSAITCMRAKCTAALRQKYICSMFTTVFAIGFVREHLQLLCKVIGSWGLPLPLHALVKWPLARLVLSRCISRCLSWWGVSHSCTNRWATPALHFPQ